MGPIARAMLHLLLEEAQLCGAVARPMTGYNIEVESSPEMDRRLSVSRPGSGPRSGACYDHLFLAARRRRLRS